MIGAQKTIATPVGEQFYWMGQIKNSTKGCALVFTGTQDVGYYRGGKSISIPGTMIDLQLFDADEVKISPAPISAVYPTAPAKQYYFSHIFFRTGDGGGYGRRREPGDLLTSVEATGKGLLAKGKVARIESDKYMDFPSGEGSLEIELDETHSLIRAIGTNSVRNEQLECEFGKLF